MLNNPHPHVLIIWHGATGMCFQTKWNGWERERNDFKSNHIFIYMCVASLFTTNTLSYHSFLFYCWLRVKGIERTSRAQTIRHKL